MAITYPRTWPAGLSPSKVRLIGQAVVSMNASPYTKSQQVYVWPGQGWAMELTFEDLDEVDGPVLHAFLLSLNGKQGTFLLGDDGRATPRGTALGSPVVDGADQTEQTLATEGWTPSQAGVLLTGDYIQIGTGAATRLFRVLTDADADASGKATLDIWPRLRTAPADGAVILVTDTVGIWRMNSNEMAAEISPPYNHDFSLTFIEAQ